ncbi:hypothetical protein VFPPC_18641 [Pochonia chlamydosporia 170]|uniref:Uncharacterized protein n=1 Tax=Pochonia chlamydosporia 170 TaxID=1380566 RepID=A0A219ANA4_METCM|nr:hypothetical protein VFPPC_18641 [Pochonia chlamydosporia 170]OWT42233.1 hypothetical protein VFPPC_18641 [Pochonia chlamydosporia 170]
MHTPRTVVGSSSYEKECGPGEQLACRLAIMSIEDTVPTYKRNNTPIQLNFTARCQTMPNSVAFGMGALFWAPTANARCLLSARCLHEARFLRKCLSHNAWAIGETNSRNSRRDSTVTFPLLHLLYLAIAMYSSHRSGRLNMLNAVARNSWLTAVIRDGHLTNLSYRMPGAATRFDDLAFDSSVVICDSLRIWRVSRRFDVESRTSHSGRCQGFMKFDPNSKRIRSNSH